MSANHVRRDKAARFQGVQAPPGDRSSRGRKTRTTAGRDRRRGIPQGSPLTPRTQKVTSALIA